jgi:hypothetical protein
MAAGKRYSPEVGGEPFGWLSSISRLLKGALQRLPGRGKPTCLAKCDRLASVESSSDPMVAALHMRCSTAH